MKKLLFIMAFGCSLGAQANTIIDTGPGRGAGGYNLDEQWLAQQFSLNSTYDISEVNGWLQALGGFSGDATVAIRADTAQGPGEELFSAAFHVSGQPSLNDWHGPNGLSWKLNPGIYWASFEVRNGQTLRGAMGGEVPHPSGPFASLRTLAWATHNSDGLGLQIIGVSSVPEPISTTLFISGLSVVLFCRRNKTPISSCHE